MKKETEVHFNFQTGEKEVKTLYTIQVERDSVSLGDDISAPHRNNISLESNDRLSDFFNKLSKNYLNNLCSDCKWKISSGNLVLGYIIFATEENPRYELAVNDDYIIHLNLELVYCSKEEG